MFIPWHHSSFRFTGRWSGLKEQAHPSASMPSAAQTTAPGAYFEFSFSGKASLLNFDLGYGAQPLPHLWIELDGAGAVEAPVDRFLRVQASTEDVHLVRVTYKGGMEQLHRWHAPLVGAIRLVGATADAPASLPPDDRQIIEFVGDSITEGVLTDADFAPDSDVYDQTLRPYQDDNLATYAALTAARLNLRPLFQAYGAVGVTHGGCGGVPRAGLIYPFVFEDTPYAGPRPDYVIINHGVNDMNSPSDLFALRYGELLDTVHRHAPQAAIICLTPFYGVFQQEIRACVDACNAAHGHCAHYICTDGWVPKEPLHPLRSGHQIIADHLTPLLSQIIAQTVSNKKK